MGTFLLVFAIVVLLVAGMSVGVIFSGKPISGTCGGIGALGISSSCDICGGNTQKCEEENQRAGSEAVAPEDLAYDAGAVGRKQ
ncbi:MAG: (Na+)-NQR maturation NqrM [Marinobacter sp.]|uniref:(Na+)-NQR maturation NqrM n=1 Tax=Marinobacter sp. TaxID=50741 RepID=UPI003F9DDDBF